MVVGWLLFVVVVGYWLLLVSVVGCYSFVVDVVWRLVLVVCSCGCLAWCVVVWFSLFIFGLLFDGKCCSYVVILLVRCCVLFG